MSNKYLAKDGSPHPDTVEQAAKEYADSDIKELGVDGLKSFQKRVKFGDIIINGYASLANPNRVGVFVKALSGMIVCTDCKGHFYEPCLDRKSKLLIVGNILAGSKWQQEQSVIDVEKDKNGEMLKVAMALVRCGWQMACDELLTWCNDKKVTPQFIDQIIEMMDKEKKKQFNWVKLREEMEKMDVAHLMPKTK